MKIEIKKERRKTIVLKVLDSQNAILKAPIRASSKVIDEFLKSKQTWLKNTVDKMLESETFVKSFEFGKIAYILGEKVGEFDKLIAGFANFSAERKAREIKKFYLSHFEVLEKEVERISSLTGLKYDQVIPISSVRVWGSFNTKRQMKLNIKLLLLPENLVNYVICHELCHSIQMNHSPKFWAALESVYPNARLSKRSLSSFSPLLKKDFFV